MTNQYPAQHRLRTTYDFRSVFKGAKKRKINGLTLLARASQNPYPRLGISVAKRQVARAVDRNRLKRVIRESFRMYQQRLIGYDMVVLVYRDCVAKTNRELFTLLEQLWKRSIA